MKKEIIDTVAELKITSADIQEIKARVDYMYALKDSLTEKHIPKENNFLCSRTQHEFNAEDGELIEGLVWVTQIHTTGSDFGWKPCISLWRDMIMYQRGVSIEEGLENSETEKVMVQNERFKVSLIRDEARGATDTCWGTKILNHKFAVFNSENELIYATENDWEFYMLLEGRINPDVDPKGLYEFMSKGNPFKMKIVPLNDKDATDAILTRLGLGENHLDRFSNQHGTIDKFSNEQGTIGDNVFVAIIMGIGTYNGWDFKRKGYIWNSETLTWFIFKSGQQNPTNDDALEQLISIHHKYDHSDFCEVLAYAQLHKENLNTMDLRFKKLLYDQATEKLFPKVRRIMNLGNNFEAYVNKATDFLNSVTHSEA